MKSRLALILGLATASVCASAQMAITEYMYGGADGEFIEFTNIGSSSINMAGWSFDDNHELFGTEDLSAFGTVVAGQSVILTETDATVFRTDWGLSGSVMVIGGNTFNLGRDDEINLYNGSVLVDRLTYGDDTLGGPRATGVSAIVDPSHYGQNDITDWVLSVNGVGGAHTSVDGDLGSPGFAPTPEPSTILAIGLGVACIVRRRKSSKS